MPIDSMLNKQRSICRVGKLRMGERKQPNRPGFQRDTWRLTTSNKSALEAMLPVYGGKILPFPTNPGEWELDSTSSQLSVILDTTLSIDENYLQQDGKTTSHKCDGVNCVYLEIKRGQDKKIVSAIERGVVPCLCDPEFAEARFDSDGDMELPDPLSDDKRACDLVTTLRVIVPASGDITLWEFSSKGQIFNKEVFGIVESLRQMGIRQAYCHLTINRLEKHRGDKVSKFGVARLTIDPNPPNFARTLLANTPLAQVQALQSQPSAIPSPPSVLPAPDRKAANKAHSLTQEQGAELRVRIDKLGLNGPEFLVSAFNEKEIGFAALLKRMARLESEKAERSKVEVLETVEGQLVEDEKPDPFADAQPGLSL